MERTRPVGDDPPFSLSNISNETDPPVSSGDVGSHVKEHEDPPVFSNPPESSDDAGLQAEEEEDPPESSDGVGVTGRAREQRTPRIIRIGRVYVAEAPFVGVPRRHRGAFDALRRRIMGETGAHVSVGCGELAVGASSHAAVAAALGVIARSLLSLTSLRRASHRRR